MQANFHGSVSVLSSCIVNAFVCICVGLSDSYTEFQKQCICVILCFFLAVAFEKPSRNSPPIVFA